MKILFITTHINIGGVTRYIYDISSRLVKNGTSCYVASSGGEFNDLFTKAGVSLIDCNMKTKFEFHPKLVFEVIKLTKFVKENNIDIIHAHTRVSQIIACMVSKITGKVFVSTCHGFFKHNKVFRKIFPCWGKKVIAISDAVKTHLIEDFKIKEEDVAVIYNGVDVQAYEHIIAEEQKNKMLKEFDFLSGPIVGTIGRLSPVKGYNYLLHAIKYIKKYIPEINMILIGDGPQKQYLMELAQQLGISENVFFLGSRMDVKKIYPVMDVYVLPSLQEGLGLSLIEAMASEKACVATNVGGISNIISNWEDGLLVDAADSLALADTIRKLIGDSFTRMALGKRARVKVKEKFDIKDTVINTLKFYEEVLNEKK
ncbi:MAG: glycosyltransferase family 4 protein [Candidatus Omnitrophica bacterium]|nr:glycosyltransferase family 4 protein [Candidatus Omnitrophota bacterium]